MNSHYAMSISQFYEHANQHPNRYYIHKGTSSPLNEILLPVWFLYGSKSETIPHLVPDNLLEHLPKNNIGKSVFVYMIELEVIPLVKGFYMRVRPIRLQTSAHAHDTIFSCILPEENRRPEFASLNLPEEISSATHDPLVFQNKVLTFDTPFRVPNKRHIKYNMAERLRVVAELPDIDFKVHWLDLPDFRRTLNYEISNTIQGRSKINRSGYIPPWLQARIEAFDTLVDLIKSGKAGQLV